MVGREGLLRMVAAVQRLRKVSTRPGGASSRGTGKRPTAPEGGLGLREAWAAVPQARRRVAVYWLAVMARRSEAARSQKAATAEPLPGRGGEPWSR